MKNKLKVFKCDDLSWVIAKDEESARKCFLDLYELDEEEKEKVEIKEETDIEHKGYWMEVDLGDIVNELNFAKDGEFKIKKKNGYWLFETFKKLLDKIEYNEKFKPFEICSTEY